MATEKLVDAQFVARLTQGSYETAIGVVDEAVAAQAKLFGVTAESLTTLATYPEHLIVATKDGDFFRAKWGISEDGDVEISDVENIDVPVYEASSVSARVREESTQIVGQLLAGNLEEATDNLVGMYKLFRSGVRLTAEGVEDAYGQQSFEEDDWFVATRESEKTIRTFLGTDAVRLDVPKPRFEELLREESDEDGESFRQTVKAAVSRLKSRFEAMKKSLALAREVHGEYQLRGEGAEVMATTDFVDFVQGLSEAMDGALAILGDAEAVVEDGCVKCIARVHDGLASSAYEWVLATAFAEKLARRFEPPAAA